MTVAGTETTAPDMCLFIIFPRFRFGRRKHGVHHFEPVQQEAQSEPAYPAPPYQCWCQDMMEHWENFLDERAGAREDEENLAGDGEGSSADDVADAKGKYA